MVLPAVFVSQGAPTLALEAGAAHAFLRHLGQNLERPRAILCVSAHWETAGPTVSTAVWPRTIHNFGGFPDALYQLRYPAPGAPELARQVVELLRAAGLAALSDPERGLDHGAWVPLLLMYPDADIPVVQLSIQSHIGPAQHLAVGRALAALREQGVLILASGSATHNLGAFRTYRGDDVPEWVVRFDRWLAQALAAGDTEALLAYRQLAPEAVRNHPSEEHLLPLFVALGAGGPRPVIQQLHASYTCGILSMAAYAFDSKAEAPESLQWSAEAVSL